MAKVLVLIKIPPGVVISIWPEVALEGMVATICDEELEKLVIDAVDLHGSRIGQTAARHGETRIDNATVGAQRSDPRLHVKERRTGAAAAGIGGGNDARSGIGRHGGDQDVVLVGV
jgi:hypothetical protein